MSVGQGNISFTTKIPPAAPAGVSGARNGLSIDALLNAVLGQDVGEPGDPAALLNDREIPLSGFNLNLKGSLIDCNINDTTGIFEIQDPASNWMFYMEPAIEEAAIGDWNNFINPVIEIRGSLGGSQNPLIDIYCPALNGDLAQASVFVNPETKFWVSLDRPSTGNTFNIRMEETFLSLETADPIRRRVLFLDHASNLYQIGDIETKQNGTRISIDDTSNEVRISNAANNAVIEMNGVNGVTGVFAPVNSITVNGGIVTAVS